MYLCCSISITQLSIAIVWYLVCTLSRQIPQTAPTVDHRPSHHSIMSPDDCCICFFCVRVCECSHYQYNVINKCYTKMALCHLPDSKFLHHYLIPFPHTQIHSIMMVSICNCFVHSSFVSSISSQFT
jgi:hypothetical protein